MNLLLWLVTRFLPAEWREIVLKVIDAILRLQSGEEVEYFVFYKGRRVRGTFKDVTPV